MTSTVVTRFAPSPTGFLHIGGARTALFNWLYAKAKGGTMLLRIEDTDRARSTEGAILAILDGLRWLELDWDGEPVYQLARAARHREAAEQLLAAGKAYRCYASAEELAAMRELARAHGRAPGYDGTWRDRDESDVRSALDAGVGALLGLLVEVPVGAAHAGLVLLRLGEHGGAQRRSRERRSNHRESDLLHGSLPCPLLNG